MYHNIIHGSPAPTEHFYVAMITPVIQYCMGGFGVDVNSMCMDGNGKFIQGSSAAVEVAGGIHGHIRIGGNSLLDAVVFGRGAGEHIAKALLGTAAKFTNAFELSGVGLSVAAETSKLAGGMKTT